MPRYIAIEHNSGYIWGDVVAADPETACRLIATAADPASADAQADWQRIGHRITDTDGGYWLHQAPDGFSEIDDGRDEGLIDRVGRLPLVGCYRPTATAEDWGSRA